MENIKERIDHVVDNWMCSIERAKVADIVRSSKDTNVVKHAFLSDTESCKSYPTAKVEENNWGYSQLIDHLHKLLNDDTGCAGSPGLTGLRRISLLYRERTGNFGCFGPV